MTPAHMGIAALGWTKPKGTPAQARAKMHVHKGQIAEISALSFRSGTRPLRRLLWKEKPFSGRGPADPSISMMSVLGQVRRLSMLRRTVRC